MDYRERLEFPVIFVLKIYILKKTTTENTENTLFYDSVTLRVFRGE
jgi:hypothetical protein